PPTPGRPPPTRARGEWVVRGQQVLDQLDILGVDEGLQVHHAHVAAATEVARLVQHEREAARHARREVASGAAAYHHPAARHVLAAVAAYPFHRREGPAIADREALARDSAEVGFAAGRAVEHHVADQDVLLGHEGGLAGREDHQLAAGGALAGVVV